MAVELDGAAIGLDQTGDHVEDGGLAGAVRAQQTHRLAAADIDADATNHLAGPKTLFHAMHSQVACPRRQPRGDGRAVGLAGPRFFGLRLFSSRRFRFQHRRVADDRRRVAHRGGQHLAHGVAERGNVLARARKSWRDALRRTAAGRRRNMPSKSTIPASLSLSG